MTPAGAYRAAVDAGRIEEDAAQLDALNALNALCTALNQAPPRSRRGAATAGRLGQFADRLIVRFRRRAATPQAPRGIYLWGGVGRGKTFLMDLFHEALPPGMAERAHFHEFMQALHRELRQLGARANPLEQLGAELAARAPVLCLDEMQVEDITDAMLMARLLESLFSNGVTLVATSNSPPHELYRAGLQRDRFLPAIALLEQNCDLMELQGPVDYRLRALARAPVYLMPTGAAADAAMAEQFRRLSGAEIAPESVAINDRRIPAQAAAGGMVWLDFDVLCNIPRSKNDYVELARCYHTVLLSNLRRLDDEEADRVHRLITLVDALYDRRCKLICSADAGPADLYAGRDMAFPFARTASRLIEMRTRHYLARSHLG
jgi:cell division protein ZapE